MTAQPNEEEPPDAISVNDYDDDTQYEFYGKSDRLRRLWPQVLAVMAKNTLGMNFGLAIGFNTIVIPAVSRPNEDLTLTSTQLAWYGSMVFMVIPFGCLLSGPTATTFGRKKSMLLSTLPLFGSWWIYYYANGPGMLYLACALLAFINGLIEAAIVTYVAEVTEPTWRGMLASSSSVAATFGVFIQFLIGSLLPWRRAALVNLAFPVLSFVVMLWVPESPYWLAQHGRAEDAGRALEWLRGWRSRDYVQAELDHVLRTNPPFTSAENPWRNLCRCRNTELYLRKTFMVPLGMVGVCFVIGQFSGMASIQTYAVEIFETLDPGSSGYLLTTLLGVSQVVGGALAAGVMPFTGKLKLSIVALSVQTGSLLLAASLAAGPAPAALLLLSSFCTNATTRVVPWVLMSEMFRGETRSVGSGLCSAICYGLGFLSTNTFPAFKSWLGLHNVLYVYALVSLLGVLFYATILPETEGKSLFQVQNYFQNKYGTQEKLNSKTQLTKC